MANMKRSICVAAYMNTLFFQRCGAFQLSGRSYICSRNPQHCHIFSSSKVLPTPPHVSSTYESSSCLYSTTKKEKILTPEQIEAALGPGRIIASEPFSWSQLQYIVNEGNPAMHSRSMEVQYDYIEHSKMVKKEWKSVNDYILHNKFGFDKILNSETGIYEVDPLQSLEAVKKEQRIEKRLLLNEYPYFVEDGIEHWCLWKLGGLVTQDEINDAIIELKERENLKDVLSWTNPPHLQSIKDIDHAHLLCLFDK